MLTKLISHEWKDTFKVPALLLTITVLLSAASLVYFSVADQASAGTDLNVRNFVLYIAYILILSGLSMILTIYFAIRFYKNLYTDEGYLMFTLPVSRSQLIWSKLIVSMAWGILSAVLAALMWTMVLSVAGGENLFAGIFRGLRSLMESLSGNATGCIVGLVVLLLAAELASYLRFYAAISLGHSFSNHKLLLSVVFYIGFGIAVQTILSVVTAAGIRIDVDPDFWVDPPAAVLLSYVIWGTAAWSVLECAAYYILTLLTLKKRLNLQ